MAEKTGKTYLAIDLKSFYASVECVDQGLDPLTAFLVVADVSRTDQTICLAVSPALKALGVPGRPRLFEAKEAVRRINALRKERAPGHILKTKVWDSVTLSKDPAAELVFHAATPRMARYIEVSTEVYGNYLRYVAPEDIHVYSVDEVFIDATPYLKTYGLSAHDFAMKLIREVLSETGVTATAGIGTNLYLAKIAMDIKAKKMKPDADGVRIAALTEQSYREELWDHRPLTDFWRIGAGTARRLEVYRMYTMGDVAERSCHDEELFYKLFGINAELLIDHAWGYESCTMAEIKSYRPSSKSLSSGQVLSRPYKAEHALTVVREMTDALSLDLTEKGLVTDQLTLYVGYDRKSPAEPVTGSVNLKKPTDLSNALMEAISALYERIVDPGLWIRRIYLGANHVIPKTEAEKQRGNEQLSLFEDYDTVEARRQEEKASEARETRMQEAVLAIKRKFGKNAVLRGLSFKEGATARERNLQIGGHKA